ncbi:hypothetical protein [Algoriphagus terrigena]|uniref:hypothetical protein n=1 Tax=Algoriphagus terrigena TaxID=344884 RepID=UPI0004163A58|nr:hypothetical protein [Algoriphagus terrigena]
MTHQKRQFWTLRPSLAKSIGLLLLLASCGKVIKVSPSYPTDTERLTILANANEGNQGLLDYTGDVYVHLGVITNKSEHELDWRYVKFAWGSRDSAALATPVGKNKWEYPIGNIREFFGVPQDEKIYKLAVLFRSGACIDVYCKVLRNLDESDLMIPIESQPSTD